MLDRPDFGGVVPVVVRVINVRPLRNRAAASWGLAGLLGWVCLVPGAAWATHEMDHRFVVSGQVRDKDGKPLKDVRVLVRDLGDTTVEPVSTYADGNGVYKVLIHLHDKNAGDVIQVTVKDEKAGFEETRKVRAEFNPTDRHTERQATVNFGQGSEQTVGSGPEGIVGAADSSNVWLYITGGILAAAAVGVASMRFRRQQTGAGVKKRKKKRAAN